jgi:hypothetical protein
MGEVGSPQGQPRDGGCPNRNESIVAGRERGAIRSSECDTALRDVTDASGGDR